MSKRRTFSTFISATLLTLAGIASFAFATPVESHITVLNGHQASVAPTESFRYEATDFDILQIGQSMPAAFDVIGGRGLKLVSRMTISNAVHFVFEHPLHAELAASLLLREGRMAGTISHVGGLRTVFGSVRMGESTLRIMDSANDLPCGQEDLKPPVANEGGAEGAVAGAACDDGSRVDLLVAYTSAAVVQAGGVVQLGDTILWAVADSNAIYAASGISLTVRLVGTTLTEYIEDASMSNDLYRLRNTEDGQLDEVSVLRNTLGADLVALIRADGGGYCGIAYLVGSSVDNAPYGVSVTALGCIFGKTFTHELGHNMGCCHAPGDGGGCTNGGVFPYSTGHRFVGTNGTQYITVMAYTPGTRVGRFSSPLVAFEGTPTGLADVSDNARSMNQTRFVFSNFRCEQNCPGDVNSNGVVDGSDLTAILSTWGTNGGSVGGDINGDGIVNGLDLSFVLSGWGVCSGTVIPTISAVSPASGSTAGGTAITITGTSLTGATSVTVGGVAATSVVVVSSTSVTAVTPAGTAGAKNVAVTTPSGTASLASAFTYVVPTGWYTVLEQNVNAAVVTNVTMRNAITASGLPWRVRDNSSNIEMLLVPAGTFTMGCSPSNSYACNSVESPTHQVTLTQAFYMGRYEVTQAQWTAKMGSNPSSFSGYSDSPSRPVEQVSWNMIASGSTSFMSLTGLRLPTEAEWEYAYRAGTTTAFHSYPAQPTGFNDDTLLGNIAWYSSNSGGQTHAVGGKLANGLGLHDMSGNVWEWCQDWYGPYSSASVINPTGPTTGTYRLLRGGGWDIFSYFCRASRRGLNTPDYVYDGHGFRVARTP